MVDTSTSTSNSSKIEERITFTPVQLALFLSLIYAAITLNETIKDKNWIGWIIVILILFFIWWLAAYFIPKDKVIVS